MRLLLTLLVVLLAGLCGTHPFAHAHALEPGYLEISQETDSELACILAQARRTAARQWIST